MSILRVSRIIESRHMTSIIACLYMRGTMGKSEIYQSISNSPNMAQKLRILADEGLITSTYNGRRTEISLTDKGTTVAEALCDMEEKVYGSVGDLQRYQDGEISFDWGPGPSYEWFETGRGKRGTGPLR